MCVLCILLQKLVVENRSQVAVEVPDPATARAICVLRAPEVPLSCTQRLPPNHISAIILLARAQLRDLAQTGGQV